MHNAIRVINNTLFMSLDAIYIFDYKIFFVINNVFKIKTWNMLPMCSSKI